MYSLALPAGDQTFRFDWPGLLYDFVLVLSNGLQLHMANLKLQALGWIRVARLCAVLTTVIVAALLAFVLADHLWSFCILMLSCQQVLSAEQFRTLDEMYRAAHVAFNWWIRLSPIFHRYADKHANARYAESPMTFHFETSLGHGMFIYWFYIPVLLQTVGFLYSGLRALASPKRGSDVKWTVACLATNWLLIVVGIFTSSFGRQWTASTIGPTRRFYITIDFTLQIFNALLLSGMMGPQKWVNPIASFQKLAEEAGFGLANRRVAFPGQINESAHDCIVSFPGKYSNLWDEAVSVSTERKDVCSLACVFLTDREAGLGRHVDNPDTPGTCWCHVIYGHMPASAYISVADASAIDSQALAFLKADAKAMGQLLLLKQSQAAWTWDEQLAEAKEKAESLCHENHGRAPWGCKWFGDWKSNVDSAVRLGQTLHVFYFEDRVGAGKLSWEQLGNQDARQRAREVGGLGASQTAEVAYLDKMGLPYVEHDISEFTALVASHYVV